MNTTQPRNGNKFAPKATATETQTEAVAEKKKFPPRKPRTKDYRFQLVEDHSRMKPKDMKTGEMVDNPYPPVFFIENEGVAIHPETGLQERWRYLNGYASIWVKDQTNPKPEKAQLMNAKNTIKFEQGFLRVKPSDKALYDAVTVQDVFEGNKNQIEKRPAIYRLIDEEKAFDEAMESVDRAYEAEKAVREASAEELLPLAMVFGLENQNGLDDEPRLRKQLILRAKQSPQAVLTNLIDPRNKVKYMVTSAINTGYLEAIEGTLKYKDTGVIITNIDSEKDVAEQVAKLFVQGDEDIAKLYEQLQVVMA